MTDPLPTLRQPSRLSLTVLIGLALVPYFLMLGTPPLWDANEPLYAQPPKEVLTWTEGDFLAPTWNGRPYFAHPPLSTWITMPFYAWLGCNEFGERLPMALAAALVVLAAYRLGRMAGGRRIGLLAAVGLAATPRYWLFCRQLSGDVYFVALLTWAIALALPALSGRGGLRSLRAANVLVGFGFVAKGPVILVLYGGTLLFVWLLARPRVLLARLRPIRGLLLILVLGVPWFAYMAIRYSDLQFLGQYFGHYTFGRVVGNIGQRGLAFYPRILLGDAQPWITLLPFAGWMAWRARDRRPAALAPWLLMAWVVLFFSVSAGKRNVYMLPLYPFMAVAVAPLALAVLDGAHRGGVRLAGFGAAVGCLGAAACLHMLGVNEPRLRPEIYWPIGLLGLVTVPLFAAGWRGAGRWLTVGSLATILCAQAALALAFPALARFKPVPDMAARVRLEQDAAAPEPMIIYRAAIHSMNFYLDRRTHVASSAQDLLAKMDGARSAFLLIPARRFDTGGPAPRGLRHELPGAQFEELERRPLLTFRFERSILGRGRTTKDLLLLRLTLPEKSVEAGGSGGEDRPPR